MIDWEDSQDGFEMLSFINDDKELLRKIYKSSIEDLCYKDFINKKIDELVEKDGKGLLPNAWI
jgi:hypothetical protein